MSEIRNRIITISGDPGSGKSTIIGQLKKDYEEKGYKVHIISVGEVFRELAKERGMSVGEFNKFATENSDIDKMIDSKVAQMAKEINSKERENEVFIFDSRLAAFLEIEGAINVRTTVESRIAGQRVFADNKRGQEDKYSSVEEATKQTELRKEIDRERFIKLYGYDIQDVERYNLVIDTSYSEVEDIAKVIEECLKIEFKRDILQKQYLKLKEECEKFGLESSHPKLKELVELQKELQRTRYAKMWTSPKTLLPLQSIRDTYGSGVASGTLEEMVEKMQKEGYNPSSEMEIIDVDGKKYIIDGHHRNFAAGYIGNTLVPYITVAKDDEIIPYYRGTARTRAKSLNRSILYDHEAILDKKDENGNTIEMFSYEYIYPGIYKELDERDDDWYI